MSVKSDVYSAISEIRDEYSLEGEVSDDDEMLSIMDSMNVLEVLLVLEGKGYDIRLIEVGGIGTVRNLIDILGE